MPSGTQTQPQWIEFTAYPYSIELLREKLPEWAHPDTAEGAEEKAHWAHHQ